MLSSVTEEWTILVAMIIAMSTDLRPGEVESGGCAVAYVDADEESRGDDRVENNPKQTSGQTVRR